MRRLANRSIVPMGRPWVQGSRLVLLVAAVIVLNGRGAIGQTPGSSAAPPLARYLPQQDLAAYLEFEGLDAHAAAWHKSTAYKLLSDTSLGTLLEDIATQAIDQAQKSGREDKRVAAADYLNLLKHAARNGLALGVFGKGPDNTHVVVVVRKGNQPEIARLLETLAAAGPCQPEQKPEPAQKSGRAVHALGTDMVWWVEQDDLILIDNDSFDTIVGVIDGKQPSAASHPLRAALTQAKDGFEPAAYGFVDLAAVPPVPEKAAKAGFDGVKRIELQWGFQDEALMTLVRVVAPSPRRGVLAFFDQPTFDLRSLPPLPAGHPAFAVFSVDLARTYDQFVALVKATDPEGEQGVEAFENAIRGQFGLDLRNDLLKHLGPKLALYSQATAPSPGGNPMAAIMAAYTGVTLTFQVRDEGAVRRQLEVLIKGINQVLVQRPAAAGGDPPQFRKKDGPRTEYVLEFPPGSIPDGPQGMLSPTIALDNEQLSISATSAAAEKALALVAGPADKRWSPTDASVRVAERIPHNLMMLVITDPRETMPAVIESLPAIVQALNTQMAQARGGRDGPEFNLRVDPQKLPRADQLRPLLFPASTSLTVDAQGIQILQREAVPSLTSPTTSGFLVGLLLPATQSAREAARRAQCSNNIKQIMLAMHNYHSANNSFPRDITDKDGKPLLSWRVAILPYIEQAELYNKFKLDEPWDSPHNKELLKEMPPTFKCPSRVKPEPFTTTYRGFVGTGAMFETGQDIGIASIADGTSNTIAVAEASEAVPWSKPADLPFDPQAKPSLYGAGSSHPGGFNCGFADGSVRYIKNSVDAIVFKALITRNGGEVLNADAF